MIQTPFKTVDNDSDNDQIMISTIQKPFETADNVLDNDLQYGDLSTICSIFLLFANLNARL